MPLTHFANQPLGSGSVLGWNTSSEILIVFLTLCTTAFKMAPPESPDKKGEDFGIGA